MTDSSVLKNKLIPEQKRLLKSLPLFLQKSQTRVERIDLSTKWLNTWKITTDKCILISFFFYEIQEMKAKTKEFELSGSSLWPCVWSILGHTGIRCWLQNWAPSEWPGLLGASWGGWILKRENKINCYILYPLHYTQNTLQINILKQQIIMVKYI